VNVPIHITWLLSFYVRCYATVNPELTRYLGWLYVFLGHSELEHLLPVCPRLNTVIPCYPVLNPSNIDIFIVPYVLNNTIRVHRALTPSPPMPLAIIIVYWWLYRCLYLRVYPRTYDVLARGISITPIVTSYTITSIFT
jgi:hypothetical protein